MGRLLIIALLLRAAAGCGGGAGTSDLGSDPGNADGGGDLSMFGDGGGPPCGNPSEACCAGGACFGTTAQCCDGVCIDLDNQNNCGGCGAICTAAAPATAVCGGDRLRPSDREHACLITLWHEAPLAGPALNSLAADAGYVYWAGPNTNGVDPHNMYRVPIGGGTPSVLLDGQTADCLALSDTHIYFYGGPGKVMRMPKSGGAAELLGTISYLGSPLWVCPLAVGDTHVYGLTRGTGEVWRVPLAGGTPALITPARLPGAAALGGLAIDSTYAYYGYAGNNQIMKVALAGGSPTPIAVTPQEPAALTLFGGELYWAAQGGKIRKVSTSGGTVTELATLPVHPTALVVDGANIYVAGGGVWKVPVAGGSPAALIRGGSAEFTSALAVDATNVYFPMQGAAVPVPPSMGSFVYQMLK